MATTSPTSPTPADPTIGTGVAEEDWEVRATRQIVETVDKIRQQTAGRAITIAGYVLLAAFAVSLGTVALIIFVIGGVRLLDVYLPDAVFGENHMWAAHGLMGLALLLSGLLLFLTKARRRKREDSGAS